MLRRFVTLACLLACCSLAHAAPTCVNGSNTAAPTASLTFTAPTLQSNGTALPAGTTLTYNLYQGTASGAEVKVASGLSGSPIAVSTGLVAGVTYYWYLTAVDAGGESAPTNEVCKAFTAAVPGIFTITIQ